MVRRSLEVPTTDENSDDDCSGPVSCTPAALAKSPAARSRRNAAPAASFPGCMASGLLVPSFIDEAERRPRGHDTPRDEKPRCTRPVQCGGSPRAPSPVRRTVVPSCENVNHQFRRFRKDSRCAARTDTRTAGHESLAAGRLRRLAMQQQRHSTTLAPSRKRSRRGGPISGPPRRSSGGSRRAPRPPPRAPSTGGCGGPRRSRAR